MCWDEWILPERALGRDVVDVGAVFVIFGCIYMLALTPCITE